MTLKNSEKSLSEPPSRYRIISSIVRVRSDDISKLAEIFDRRSRIVFFRSPGRISIENGHGSKTKLRNTAMPGKFSFRNSKYSGKYQMFIVVTLQQILHSIWASCPRPPCARYF